MSPIGDLIEEISNEPELAKPSRTRTAAEARLDEADLVKQVLFEIDLGGKFEGRAWRQLSDDLWLYAWPVVKAFLRTNQMGRVLQRYAAHRVVAIRPEDMVVLAHSEEERDALAVDVIYSAIKDFRKHAIMERRWQPTGGASLRTWFIGACAFNFPRAYQKWTNERGGRLERVAKGHDIDLDAIGGQIAVRVPDPSVVAAHRDDLRAMIDKAQPTTKVILGLLLQGLTQAQIATELGLTVRAVEGRLYRFRSRVIADRDRRNFLFLVPFQPAAPRGAK